MLARARVSAWLTRRETLDRGDHGRLDGDDPVPVASPRDGRPLRARPRHRRTASQPGTGAWWATRPLWLALLTAVLVPLALALSRFERSRRPAGPAARTLETLTGRVAAVLGVVLVTLGLLGFVASGFTPLLDPGGPAGLRVDPLQNVAWWWRRTPRGRPAPCHRPPRPWLLAAAGSAPSWRCRPPGQ